MRTEHSIIAAIAGRCKCALCKEIREKRARVKELQEEVKQLQCDINDLYDRED